MLKTTQKEIRRYGAKEELFKRLNDYQKSHNTSGVCSAYTLGLECIAYSVGVYGCNGHLYRDLETGKLLGMPERNLFIYID